MAQAIYEIIFSKSAEKQFLKLEKNTQIRIKNSLLRIRTRPYAYVKKLVGEDEFKLRVGEYRILLDIDNGKLIILVINIKHRRNIYKEL